MADSYRHRGNGNGRGSGEQQRGYGDRGDGDRRGGNGNGGRGGNGNGNGGGGGGDGNGGRGDGNGGRGGPDQQRSFRRERSDSNGHEEGPAARRPRTSPGDNDGGGAHGPSLRQPMEQGVRARREWRVVPVDERFDFVESRAEGFSKKGTSGTSLSLTSNYFVLKKRPAWKIFHYHVHFEPEERITRVKVNMLNVHRERLGAYVFDGHSLWTFQSLDPANMRLESAVRRGDENIIVLTIVLVGELEPSDVQCLQVYNVIMRKCFETLKLELIGRNYFDGEQAIAFNQNRFELWPGYVTTIRNFEQGLMLNVEVCHRLLRNDTAWEIMSGHCRNGSFDENSIKGELVGSTVMTSYNRKMYKIDDISFEMTPSSTFLLGRDKVETSYGDYYRNKYGQAIRNMRSPLLATRPKKKEFHRGKRETVYLIPELCQMTGLTDSIRSNFRLMKDIGEHTHQKPDKKLHTIQQFMNRLQENEQISTELKRWGLAFSTAPVKLEGRVVPKERIQMEPGSAQGKDVTPNENADWTHAFREKKMCVSMKLVGNWILVVTNKDVSGVDNLIRCMGNVGRSMGFVVTPPLQVITISDGYGESFTEAIKQGISNHGKKVELVFAILPTNSLDVYAAVKKLCCITYGVASQCFVSKNLHNSKGLMSIATKVVVQINAKLGGEPWRVLNPFKKSYLMVVGYDVHHCGKRKGSSVGAMVATTNNELSKYYSTVSTINIHEEKELSATMCSDMTKCIDAFRKRNDNNLPDRIILFRDGVGEGQLKYVHSTELEEIKESLKGVYGHKEPAKLTFVVVTKKISTRLFTDRGSPNNPPPGTIVDDIITLPERYDFYLISQNAKQGTVSPTCYNVIWDQQGVDADKLQRFAYKLTHLYYNWSGTVSVPAPCQYAHKLAFLAGTTMNGMEIKERLCDYLYYL